MRGYALFLLLFAAMPAAAAEPADNPQIDFSRYVALAGEVEPWRAERLIGFQAFRAAARENGTLVLDARSAEAFAEGHIAGAVNLPLPDFNAASLAALIGANRERRILIYCNNNFADDRPPVPLKMVELALNIQTMINLYGYGYRNVWELAEIVDMDDPMTGWVSGD